MAKINGKALTEKGVVKTAVRNGIAERETQAFGVNNLKEYSKVEDKNIYVKSFTDADGKQVYATWTLTVSTKHPLELAPKKSTKKSKDPETFVIEE